MGQALYRKYRSRSLEELVGQEHVTDTLARAIKAGRISHAYLFTGPRGTGKTSVARILAHQINSLPYSDKTHLDIIEIDAASNRRIDDIRDLRDKVFIAPVSAKYKVYIIDEVHMLTGESFNALLKTLEEPPAHVVFILATTEVHKLPATIISRTQRFSFRPGSPEKVVGHLRALADKESIKITDDALALIAEHGEGSFRDSVSLLDQLSHANTGEVTADDVAALLGLAPKEQLDSLAKSVAQSDVKAIAAQLQTLTASGSNAGTLAAQLGKKLANDALTNPRLFTVIDGLLDVPRAYNPDLKLLTVLMREASQSAPKIEPKNAPALVTTAAPVAVAELPKPIKRQTQTHETKSSNPISPAKAPAQPEETPGSPLKSLTNEEWHKVLSAIKKANAPLFSVVKHAEPVFNAADNALLLKCKYPLHRKKIDDPKQKIAIADIMAVTLGGKPYITTEVDTNAVPPGPPPADPMAASVAAIMGGGEVIDAETTN